MWHRILFFIRSTLRSLISTIDGLIYTADAEIYDLMIRIAKTKVLTTETINSIAGRVYQLLALIMMFRIIFISINYIVNPEAMLDKAKGYGNIVKKIIITLGLIIVVPWGFQQARTIQAVVLDDNVIEYFVWGQNNASSASTGYTFMYALSKQFIQPYKCVNPECKGANIIAFERSNETSGPKEECTGNWETEVPTLLFWGALTNSDNNLNKCGYGLGGCAPNTDGDSDHDCTTNGISYGKSMYLAINPRGGKYDLRSMFNLASYADDNYEKRTKLGWNLDAYVKYNYPVIGSTLVGCFVGYMLIVMCIDVAVRSIKLAFYEMIAPVPIVSYIGPKDGKETMLSKWFTQVLKTYGSLFIRIIGLQIACLFVTEMLRNGLNGEKNVFVILFLLIGALTFAKQAPQILKDIGINFEGGGFNLKKKLENDTMFGKQIYQATTGIPKVAAGIAAGMLGGAISEGAAAGQLGKNRFFSAMRGGFTGAFRGGVGGAKAKGNMLTGSVRAIGSGYKAAGRGGQKMMEHEGSTLGGRIGASFNSTLGIPTKADRMDKAIKTQEEYSGMNTNIKSAADVHTSDLTLANPTVRTAINPTSDADITTAMAGGVKGLKKYYEDLQASGTATLPQITRARKAYEAAQEAVIDNAHNGIIPGATPTAEDDLIQTYKNQAYDYARKNRRYWDSSRVTVPTSATAAFADFKTSFAQASTEATRTKGTTEYRRAQASKAATSKKGKS